MCRFNVVQKPSVVHLSTATVGTAIRNQNLKQEKVTYVIQPYQVGRVSKIQAIVCEVVRFSEERFRFVKHLKGEKKIEKWKNKLQIMENPPQNTFENLVKEHDPHFKAKNSRKYIILPKQTLALIFLAMSFFSLFILLTKN